MAFPQSIADEISRVGIRDQFAIISHGKALADEHPCAGAQFHSPVPLVTYRVSVIGNTWTTAIPPDKPEFWIWLCGNCASNLALYQALLPTLKEWKVKREFGGYLRKIADRGWDIYQRYQAEMRS